MASRTKSVWDGPVALDYELEAAALAAQFERYTPVGTHSHDMTDKPYNPRRGRRADLPRGNKARLKYIFTNLRWYRKIKKGIQISVFSAYAKIIDIGGYVPPAIGEIGKGVKPYMHWSGSPRDTYAYSRKGYHIKPRNFIQQSVDAYVADKRGIKITWAARTSGSTASYGTPGSY